ncbi:MAG: lamin tail domain-containing protein [Prevotella pectinovora]|uniref:lamin tail domain-containing protein n=1 Tax=Prevotella pectinovora TaxID=1602169 RepID=UPI002E771BEC|nr:lamin tail domain-containing protein [Prevotella pectinovora]MEE1547046.1 lamin tail domain-containing protein [Prevotella pectinovora]
MKRNILYLAAICLAALSLAGCKTDEEPEWEDVVVPPVDNTVNGDNNNDQQPEEVIDFRAIRLNELDGNKPKFIELYNTASQAVDISGMKLRKNGEEIIYEAPAGTTIVAGGFLMLPSDQADYTTGFTSGLSAKKSVMIELLGPDDTLVDVFANPSQAMGNVWDETDPVFNGDATKEAYGRKPDGTGEWYMIQRTEGASNNDAATSEKITW